MAGTAKKFWNLSRNNKKKTVIAAYTSIAGTCSANPESAKVNAHAVLKKWHYFDQGSQANREKWGDCEMFWKQNVSQKVLEPALESCVQSEMDYRDEHKMGYEGARKVISATSSGSASNLASGSSSGNVPAANEQDDRNNRIVKLLLLAVAVVAGFMLIRKKR